MKNARQPSPAVRFLLAASLFFTIAAAAQMRHHNDSDFKSLEEKTDRIDKHVDHDDDLIEQNKSRLENIEGWAKGLGFSLGSGLLFGAATLLQKKRDSA
jgi:hypothetical protein